MENSHSAEKDVPRKLVIEKRFSKWEILKDFKHFEYMDKNGMLHVHLP